MTARQYRRLRRWELKTAGAYNAGCIEGMDAYYLGYARPEDPDLGFDAPFDLNFHIWPNDRLEQYYRNCQFARMRGAVDGFDQAAEQVKDADAEDRIAGEVEDGIAKLERMLSRKAA
jgi:hypothetical protein